MHHPFAKRYISFEFGNSIFTKNCSCNENVECWIFVTILTEIPAVCFYFVGLGTCVFRFDWVWGFINAQVLFGMILSWLRASIFFLSPSCMELANYYLNVFAHVGKGFFFLFLCFYV